MKEKSRTKKALLNVLLSMSSELVTLICGLVLPRLILSNYGSEYNGVVQSVSQFISCISIMRAGISGATKAALYKPLAEKNNKEISEILAATDKFMRKIAYIFVAFVFVFAAIYPIFICTDFDWLFSFSLILIVSISTFGEYYFGYTYQTLLMADQKEYITMVAKIIQTILNTIVSIILINGGFSIHIVKLGSSLVYLLSPIFLYFYVRKKYNIDKNAKPAMSKISQRWDAVAHEIATFVNNNTDVMILTIFTNLYEVSVYTVYHYVSANIKKIVNTFVTNFAGAFGNMYANEEYDLMNENLSIYELIINTFVSIIYSVTLVMIVPFVLIYTKGINDVEYSRPVFAILLVLASAFDCFRIPYKTIVTACGHFKQTKNGAIFEAVLNIVVSVLCVNRFGLIGVAIGSLCAMVFRTCQYAFYLSKNILNRNIKYFIKHIIFSIGTMILVILLSKLYIASNSMSILKWILNAAITTVIASVITLMINFVFYKNDMFNLIKKLKRNFIKKAK